MSRTVGANDSMFTSHTWSMRSLSVFVSDSVLLHDESGAQNFVRCMHESETETTSKSA